MILEYRQLLSQGKKIVVAGESGSGKSEFSINVSLAAAGLFSGSVILFDMDQSKSLFRSRDLADLLRGGGVKLQAPQDFMDAPIVPPGLYNALTDTRILAVMDIGGGLGASRCMGQYTDLLRQAGARVFYLINTYRSFSNTAAKVRQSLNRILPLIGCDDVLFIANSFCGSDMSEQEFLKGREQIRTVLAELGCTLSAALVPVTMAEMAAQLPEPCLVIKPHLNQILDIA
jgi:hypothetical protein